jgi:hypothetical protein
MKDPKFAEFCAFVCKGNDVAAEFLVEITEAAHFFDDLYDNDVVLTRANLLDAMWVVMVALPRNEFYRKFFWELQPLVTNAIINWRVANNLEASPSGETDLRVAFVVRSSYADLIQQTALLCGGPEWAAQVGVEVRRKCHAEPFNDYLKSVEVQHGLVQRTEATGQQSGDVGSGSGQRAHRPAADGDGPRAIRVVETERGLRPGDAPADLRPADEAG